MEAGVDSYNQANILLTVKEAKQLKEKGKLNGKIYGIKEQKYLPLRLKISKKGWRADALPLNAFYENKKSFEIDIPIGGIEKVLDKKVIGTSTLSIRMRKVFISLEGVHGYGD